LCSTEEEGLRLGADSAVFRPLAGVSPGPDNMERGDDTDSTSDICYIRSDKSSDAGDNPDDTLSANEEGSYVLQRLGCLLEEYLAGGRGRAPRFAQRTCVTVSASGGEGYLHALFGADNTGRNTCISEAEKAEQCVLQILFPHVPLVRSLPA
jgi:hypothetical protein